MVGRIVSFIQKEIGGLHEAAYVLAFAAVGSQLLALLRDRLLAHTFGAGSTLDVYYAAFRIPDILFATIGSLVSASVLIPFLAQKFASSDEHGKKFFDAVFTVFFVVIVGAAAIVWVCAPRVIPLVLPGFREAETLYSLISLTRILLLSPIFLGFSNLFASITQLRNRFFIYALSPILYNFGIIMGVLFFVPWWGVKGLAVGVVVGAALHMLVQLPFIVSQGLFPVLVSFRQWRTAREAILLSMPRTIAISANELAELVLVSLASLLSIGSISVFSFSFNLQSVPLSIIGVSYSVAAFPTLARYVSEGQGHKYLEHVITTARHIIFLCLPITALFVVLRAQIVRVILGSGKFSWADTRLTAAALALFVLSLLAQSLVLLFTRARYSTGNTKKPLIINVASSVFIIAFSFILLHAYKTMPFLQTFLSRALRVEDIPGTAVLMLPLAFSVGISCAAAIHVVSFFRDFRMDMISLELSRFNPLVRTLIDSLFVSTVIGFVAYMMLDVFDTVFSMDTFLGVFAQGFVSGVIGIMVGVIILLLIRNTELKEIWQTLHRKMWRQPVVGPDAEDVI